VKGKKISAKKASKSAKKSASKKAAAAKKSPLKKTSRSVKQSSVKKAPAKKATLKKTAPAKKNQAPDLTEVLNVSFWLKAFQTNMDVYLDLSDDNPYKYGLVDEMEDCLVQALKLDPKHVPALILFAAFRLDFGEKLNEAMKALQKAEKLSPGNKKVKTLTKRCEQAMGEVAAAKKERR
jgi:hypothetical protein